MFSRRTVFILGAGASCDLRLPSGDQLRETLVQILQANKGALRFSNEYLSQAVMARCHQKRGTDWMPAFREYADAAARIRFGLPLAISIDNYLDAHRNDPIMQELGKLAIAVAILDAERNSALNESSLPSVANVDRFSPNPTLNKSWYLPLMRLLTTGKSVEDVATLFENVAFIVFNYDRCLEQFLINGVMAYFNVTPQVAIECMARLRVVHPYGRVGYLPWQSQPLSAEFGNPAADLNRIASGLQTFTESADQGVVGEVKDLLAEAQTLVILGYGFLEQNNDLLRVNHSSIRRVFATTKDISDSDVPIVKQSISGIIAKLESKSDLDASHGSYAQIFIEREYCRDLMDNHRFRLSREPERVLTLGR